MLRRLEIAIAVTALALLIAGAALFVLHYSPAHKQVQPVVLGLQEVEKTIPVSRLVVKGAVRSQVDSEDSEETQTQPIEHKPIARTKRVLYPDWKSGSTQVLDSKSVTENNDYTGAAWSPVGLDVAFTKKDFSGIYIAGDSTTQAFMLNDDASAGRSFRWNNDGMSLHIADADGQMADLTITGEKYPSHDRPALVYERDNIIYFHPEDSNPIQVSGTEDLFVFPQVSPDETTVLFQGLQTGIYMASIQDATVITVGKGENPRWLPDSSGIVYDIPVRDSTKVVDGDLWYASADGSERTNVTRTAGIAESCPAVAPDGERIAFSSGGAIYIGRFIRAHEKEARSPLGN